MPEEGRFFKTDSDCDVLFSELMLLEQRKFELERESRQAGKDNDFEALNTTNTEWKSLMEEIKAKKKLYDQCLLKKEQE